MWLIYALGGGWGHLTRAVALARVAGRDRPVRVLTNSPYAGIVSAAERRLDIAVVDTRAAALREIEEYRPSCLIVDTFPRGIGGELAGLLGRLGCRKVLVHRDLNPRYVAQARLRAFVEEHYDVVLVPGAGEGSQFGDLPSAVQTDAWLVRSADEIPGSGQAERILGLKPGERCVLICASGKTHELDWYAGVERAVRELAPRVQVRLVAADCGVRHWPVMDLLGCAWAVVGGGGYNTVHECLAWQVPLAAKAWQRLYDRQELRIRRSAESGRVILVTEPDEAAKAALGFVQTASLPAFANGVPDAVSAIARMVPECPGWSGLSSR